MVANTQDALQPALSDAGITPEAIDHISAHGTSTPANDACEALAIKQVFGGRSVHIPVTANKSALGHSLANSGSIQAVLATLSLKQQTLLPTLNFNKACEVCDGLNYSYYHAIFQNKNHSSAIRRLRWH